MKTNAILACVAVVCACGGGGKQRRVDTPTTGDVATELANEIDPGPQEALWPQVPAEIREAIEKAVTVDAAPEARLAAARERLTLWSLSFSTTDPDEAISQIHRGLEGLYLAEPLARAAELSPITLEARAISWNFYVAFTSTEPVLRTYGENWSSNEPRLAAYLGVAKLLVDHGVKLGNRYAAEVLRAGEPEKYVDDILWHHARRRADEGAGDSARALYRRLVQRNPNPTTYEGLRRNAQAQIALDDPAAASAAIEKARAAIAPDSRDDRASLRELERDRGALAKLLALPADETIENDLVRFDLLRELNRKSVEAHLAALVAKHPLDARVRARQVQLRIGRGEISEDLMDPLRGAELANKNAEYWSMWLGAVGMAIGKTGVKETLAEINTGASELAKYEPERAAAVAFILERVVKMLDQGGDDKAILGALRGNYEAALALRSKHPDEPDIDRVVLTLALFTADPAVGFKEAAVRPRTAPDADPALYHQRAHTLVTLAAYVGKGADLAAAWQAIEDIPPSVDFEVEADREALFGDVELMRATVHGEVAAWERAVKRYQAAKRKSRFHGRLDNNLAFAAAFEGNLAGADKLYETSAGANTDRRWVPLLNVVTAPQIARDEQLKGLKMIADKWQDKTPALVNAWRAVLETDAEAAKAAATAALADYDGGHSFHQIPLHTRGLVTEGTFKLGLGLRGNRLAHELQCAAYATLWATRPMPASRADLEAKAKVGAKPPDKPGAKPPTKK
jgi:hypothetical protein